MTRTSDEQQLERADGAQGAECADEAERAGDGGRTGGGRTGGGRTDGERSIGALASRILLALAAVCAIVVAIVLGDESVALRQDTRVRVVAPAHLEDVRLPVELRWQVTDRDLADRLEEGAVYFAVCIDRPPIAPHENLSSLLTRDCLQADDCPTRSWFAERHVHLTRGTTLSLSVVPQRLGGAGELHQATIVLTDHVGTRIGESAWTARFFLARDVSGEP
jgi:hypothetical protein